MSETSPRLLQRAWVRRVVPAGAVAALVVGGTVAVRDNASASPVDTYRTTSVTTGSVEQRLNLTGSVQRVNQVSESFAVAGTVSSVLVSVGDTVRAGQSLATLDPRPLTSAVTAAKAALAKAEATLESDQTASTTASSSTSATPAQTSIPTASPSAANPSGRSAAGAHQGLARAQQRVSKAQSAIAADLGQASAALARCAPFFPSESSGSTPSPTDSSTSAATSSSTTTASTPPSGSTATTGPVPSDAEVKACIASLKTAPTQQQIQRDQQELTRSQRDLTKAVTLAITTAGNTAKAPATTSRSGSTSQSATSQSATSQSATSQSATSQSATSQSATSQSSGGAAGASNQSGAARVVSDQAAVTNAEADLKSAQADLASATLKASIAGTVGSVSLASNASSDSRSIIIVGAGAVEVTVDVPLASMGSVHVGQTASVTPQGATSSVPGAVASISLLPTATSSGTGAGTAAAQPATTASSPTYPVVVLVPDALPALASGARAEVSLLIGTAANVLTVPNSALTPLGNGQALAMTYKGGVATRALVRTGYAGTLTTQIASGLAKGQQVVLADLSTALPTNTTNARRLGVGGAGAGLGGAGLGGAGLGGAGLGGAGLGGAGLGGAGLGGAGFTRGG